jgi:hypothetical protein
MGARSRSTSGKRLKEEEDRDDCRSDRTISNCFFIFRCSRGWKAPKSVCQLAPPGSFDCAPSSAVSRDKSVWRSAQDDGFVGGYAENT